MNRPVQRLIIVLLALCLLVPIGAIGISQLLGGSEQEQQSTSEATPDGRPTADPADQPPRPEIARPEEPAGLTEQTGEGAEATLTYLLESYTYMMTSGDVSVWENSVDPNCQVCGAFLDNAELLAQQDGYLVDGEFTVRSTEFEGTGEPPATGVVTADFTQEASVLVDDPSLQPNALDEVSGTMIAQVAWDGERWRVTDLSLAPEGAEASDGGGASDAGGALAPGTGG